MEPTQKKRKLSENEGEEKADQEKNSNEEMKNAGIFYGLQIFVHPTGIGKARCKIFEKQITNLGGVFHSKLTDAVTHLIVDDNMDYDRLLRILKLSSLPGETKVVKSLWLSSCIKHKQLLGTTTWELTKPVEKAQMYDSDDESEEECNRIVVRKFSEKLAANPTNITKRNSETSSVSSPSNQVVKEKLEQQGVAKKSDEDATVAMTAVSDPEKLGAEESVKESRKVPAKVGVMWRFNKGPQMADQQSDPDSDYEDSDQEGDQEIQPGTSSGAHEDEGTSSRKPSKPLPRGNWVCAQSSYNAQPNLNKHITDKLQALAKTYENTNDKWRALGYQKAIAALKRQPKEITTWEEAKALPGVGQRLADKIWEIVESGELQKLTEVTSREETKILDLFTGIWGAGAHTARMWMQQGMRTLDDLRTKANLTRHQKIGLKYYDELLDRMSREEAAEIEERVIKATKEINPGLIAMACGSYRRGKPTCGDVDVLVTHPDGKSHKGVFHKLLHKLRAEGFLTDDLVTQEDNGAQSKYLGVCQLAPDRKHRRLDIIVVPYSEYACAIMYFTGSAHFNRSMRNLAGKMGMSLSEHSLNKGVVRRKGEKLNKGTPIPTPTEESVFEALGLKYRPPNERDH